MSIAAVRQGLADNLSEIPEVQVSAYILSRPTPPTLWVAGASIAYDMAYGSRVTGKTYTDEYTATIQGFVDFNEDIGNQQLLDQLLAPSGVYSVKRAIEADKTLAGVADTLWVASSTQTSLTTFQAVSYLLAEWSVTIIATEVAL